MYKQLSYGESLKKNVLINEFNVTAKTVQRDIDDLRLYLNESSEGDLCYDRKNDCYILERISSGFLTEKEVFVICKVLIESRAFNKEEFEVLIKKLLIPLSPKQRIPVETRIGNERVNYLQLKHGKPLIDRIWQLANQITKRQFTKIYYVRLDKTPREHLIKPVGIMFSEFYFYLISWLADDSKDYYTVFRVDRITDVVIIKERFEIPYAERFNESEFRKRVQFMYSGKLKRVKFLFKGPSLEVVFDRLPTAQVIGKTSDGRVMITAESYGDGINMWLHSQGDRVEIIE
jgi:predicted DNA-binding transcriptional regulator YafY